LRRSLYGRQSRLGRFGEETNLSGPAGIRTYVPVGNRCLILLLSAFVSLIFLSHNLFIACNIDYVLIRNLCGRGMHGQVSRVCSHHSVMSSSCGWKAAPYILNNRRRFPTSHDKWVPVTTALRVLRLRIE